ncbi:hypothetical protein GCM10009105_20590 [Dokdonella soli]|uniref:Flagellin n=1 Tax=Dokdonella soli TaxID=529810 RepID=A0ABN1IJL3_9GAMM
MSGFGELAITIGANTATLSSDLDRAVGMTQSAVANINVAINKVGSGSDFSGVSSQVAALQG